VVWIEWRGKFRGRASGGGRLRPWLSYYCHRDRKR
jgi:hypothetical protein